MRLCVLRPIGPGRGVSGPLWLLSLHWQRSSPRGRSAHLSFADRAAGAAGVRGVQDVRALLADPSRIEAEYARRVQEQASSSPQREHLQARRQRVQRGLTRLIDAYAEGLLDKAEFEPRVRGAKQRLSEL